MSRSILCAAAMAALTGLISVSADAAQFTVKFDGTDGETTNLWYGYSQGGSNTGTQPGQLLMNRPADDWFFAASLLRMKNIPADFAGATITSATLTLKDNWTNSAIHSGVEIHRIDTAANWKVGDGAQANRWPDTKIDNGAGRRVADWTGTSTNGRQGSGFDWAGNPVTGDSSADYTTFGGSLLGFEDVAMKDKIATVRLVGSGSSIPDTALLPGDIRGELTVDLTSMVQNWADGTWDVNDGFAFWMGNATEVWDGNNTQGWTTNVDGAGLTITYAVPEPATLGLLALGGLLLGRRNRA